MAVSFQQQALGRTVIYTALIVGLVTVSLLHRRRVVEPQGNNLLLREVSKGEVKLTDSAVRLALTGSRGIAVTFLWSAALKNQERHEWNELELLVSSITRLQPHFTTPWLFQSWNLAFNVAVECDRPRDKYYYISRGLEVLAEGERRNYKPPEPGKPSAPGNPDMRHNMGFYYQLKIGNSDEKNTMRCLLEMSCIDPLERDPNHSDPKRAFWEETDRGKRVRLDRFKEFCFQHPRLVRRLAEQLRYTTPEKVVRFLEENKDVPTRFEKPSSPQQKESIVKEELEQFPILPPGRSNPKSRELSTTEHVDVFWITRQWYEYAQKPLPPANSDPSLDPTFDPLVYRRPRYIAHHIFRGYPALAQYYMAENLEKEGWFDADGWVIKDWFDHERSPNDPDIRVGTEPKFHAGPAWETAHQMYIEYGALNGLYLSPSEFNELNRTADLYRRTFDVKPGVFGQVPPDWRQGEKGKSAQAHARLNYMDIYNNMTNFPEFLVQTDGERLTSTINARKLFYNAEQMRILEEPERAIPLYKQAWDLLTHVLLANPKFARLMNLQEDFYEIQISHNFYVQKHRIEVFRPTFIGVAQMPLWPNLPLEQMLTPSQKIKIMPVRNHRGILDYIIYYDGPQAAELKLALAGWTQASGHGMRLVNPVQVDFMLTFASRHDAVVTPPWRSFVNDATVMQVRQRMGLDRTEATEKK